MTPPGNLLLFGLGYTAELFCRRQQARGWRTRVIVRSEETRRRVESLGAHPINVQDLDSVHRATSEANALLIVAPPSEGHCPGLQALSPALSGRSNSQLHWIGYASSTAVYGDQKGAWTDESSPLNTTSPTGLRRFEAERAWTALCGPARLPLVILRLAGIYGPGRSALDRLREGRARRIEKNNHVLSRIHVEDLVSLLEASLQRPNQHAIYNVCDDEPASTADVVTFAATLLGVEPPAPEPFESAVMSGAAERYFLESRRISNSQAKQALDWRPQYPSYREGLTAIRNLESARS
jgi:NAD dependent epimerase/dehydratase family enzyme